MPWRLWIPLTPTLKSMWITTWYGGLVRWHRPVVHPALIRETQAALGPVEAMDHPTDLAARDAKVSLYLTHSARRSSLMMRTPYHLATGLFSPQADSPDLAYSLKFEGLAL